MSKVENLQYDLRVTIDIRYHKEGADEQVCRGARVWDKQQQGVQDGSYLKQYSLCQGSR